jgi:diguanylate cyclase (GGDEF)-like protein/PAS domain S-box-containing protein
MTSPDLSDNALRSLNTHLREQSHLLQTTLTSISQGILVFDPNTRVQTFNPQVCSLLDLPESFLATRPTLKEINDFQVARNDFGPGAMWVDERARSYILAGGLGTSPAHYLRVTTDGRTLEVKTQTLPTGGMVRTFADVSDYVQVKADLQASEQRWKLALESTGDGVWDWDIASGEEFFSKRLLEMYGYSEHELLASPGALDALTHPDDVAPMQRDRQAHFDGLTPLYTNEHRIRCKNGNLKWILTRGMVIRRDEQGRALRMIGTHTDITERKTSEALIWHQAHFDPLTRLPNRNMLRDRLAHEINASQRNSQPFALLFIDLDHFKEVNDTFGHDSGDLLLIEAARRIKACVRDTDTVARMGGDEFTVILTDMADKAHIEHLLQGILQSLAEMFQLQDEQVYVSASIGITRYPTDASVIEDLFKNADQALYVAKGAGRNRHSFFTATLHEAAQTRVRLANDLRGGLAGEQFRVVYQPIIELASGSIHKAEALIRWQHPTRGLVSPADFIPIAEASGLVVDIGEWVFQQAARQVQQWRGSIHPEFQISVNKSPVQFHHCGKLNAPWFDQLQALGLPGNSIVVEITEGLLLDSSLSVDQQLLALRAAGIGVSLDDFGTGYSSLSYLQKFNIDFIKIDQSFVRHLAPASTNLALCKAIIVMAHELGIQVVAEGIETEPQRELLTAAGCDYAQGYLFARPMSATDFEVFIAAQ